jgi:hypothetical protein
LPFQAHWGNEVLEAGKYTISLPTYGSALPVILVSGQGKTTMVLMGTPGSTEFGRSYLRIENIGEAHVIRELDFGATGKLIRFPVAKSVRNQSALEQSAQNTRVTIAQLGAN